MTNLLKVTSLVLLAICLFGAYRFGAAAQEAKASRDQISSAHFPALDAQISPDTPLATKRVLLGTYISTGNFDSAEVSGMAPGTHSVQSWFGTENGLMSAITIQTTESLNQSAISITSLFAAGNGTHITVMI